MKLGQVTDKIGKFLYDIGYLKVDKNNYIFKLIDREIVFNIQKSKYGGVYINVRFSIDEDVLIDGRMSSYGVNLYDYLWEESDFQKLIQALSNVFIPFHSSAISYKNDGGNSPLELITSKLPLFFDIVKCFGFSLAKQENFILLYRKRDIFWDVILLQVFGLNTFLYVNAGVWMPELQISDSYNESDSPDLYENLMVLQKKIYLSENEEPNLLNINNITDISYIDTCLYNWIVDDLLLYFNSINNFDSFYTSIQAGYKSSDYFSVAFEKIKEKLSM